MRVLRSQYLKLHQEQTFVAQTQCTQVANSIPSDSATARIGTDSTLTTTATCSSSLTGKDMLHTYDGAVVTMPSFTPTQSVENMLQNFEADVTASLSATTSTLSDDTQISIPENSQSTRFACNTLEGAFLLQVNIFNRNAHTPPMNIVVKFFDPDANWFTRLYRNYEGKLWYKFPREPCSKWKRWYYRCYICAQQLCSFTTLKGHLNLHMGFFPRRCAYCPKRYAMGSSLAHHRRACHKGNISLK